VESADSFLTFSGDFATLARVSASSSQVARRRATLTVVRGLADPDCVTFRTADGRFLRHYSFRLRLDFEESTELFREDATFCPDPRSSGSSATLRSHNYPERVLLHRDGEIRLDAPDGSPTFPAASSFVVHAPWAG
jgi:hypothetical protein